ncbi:helix-turn-helix domain-containing protein [Abditibacterium utsteinense]|uniref:helix-turn-helix domain-containing protein n=1 Tax=Abditibacterium utsteinense TaxID=1960156 RepID=UPI001474A556|nr:helix-turn-helix domain-containing protein [Abditibacterium utsteinense]
MNSFLEECDSPVGQLLCAGTARHAGIPSSAMRVLNVYGVIVLLEGSGRFLDANRYEVQVEAGDCLLLFPDIAHSYGPPTGGHWCEWFFHFNGSAFDLWRDKGLLNARAPVIKGGGHVLLSPLREIAARPSSTSAGHLSRVCGLLSVLGMVRGDTSPTNALSWLEHAQHILLTEINEEKSLDMVAHELGMSCSAFRARFVAESGQTPGRFRALARLHAAQKLLERPELSTKAIASSLGWSDEFAFSKNFKALCGQTPREFRRAPHGDQENSQRA